MGVGVGGGEVRVCFEVPGLPVSRNVANRMHWTGRTQERNRLTVMLQSAMRAAGVRPVLGPVRIAITFYVPTRRRWDANNHVSILLNAMVKAKLIEDDGAPLLVREDYAVRFDPDRPRMEIHIAQAGAPAWEKSAKKGRSRTIAA